MFVAEKRDLIPTLFCHFLGIWCRPQSGHVMSLLISHDSCTDVGSGVTKVKRKYRPESNSGLSDVSVVFLPVFSLPVLFFLPLLSSFPTPSRHPSTPFPPVWLHLVIQQTSAEILSCTRVQDEGRRALPSQMHFFLSRTQEPHG